MMRNHIRTDNYVKPAVIPNCGGNQRIWKLIKRFLDLKLSFKVGLILAPDSQIYEVRFM